MVAVVSSPGVPSSDAELVPKQRAATLVVALVIASCGLLVATDAGALFGLFVLERVVLDADAAMRATSSSR